MGEYEEVSNLMRPDLSILHIWIRCCNFSALAIHNCSFFFGFIPFCLRHQCLLVFSLIAFLFLCSSHSFMLNLKAVSHAKNYYHLRTYHPCIKRWEKPAINLLEDLEESCISSKFTSNFELYFVRYRFSF